MSKASLSGLDPLKDLLGDVLSRLEALETKVGIKGSSLAKQPSGSQKSSAQLLNGKSRETLGFWVREKTDPKKTVPRDNIFGS